MNVDDDHGANLAARRLDQIRAEQTRALFHNCPVGVISASVVATALAVGLASAARLGGGRAEMWSAAIIGCAIAHIVLCNLYTRAKPSDRVWRRWLGLFTVIAGLEGLGWCLGAVWMGSTHDLTQELMVLLVASAVTSGCVSVFGPFLPTYLVFMVPAIAPHVVLALKADYSYHNLLAGLEVAYLALMPLIARGFSRQFVEGLRLRFENEDLARDLRRQKDLAEQANLAKSSFLAAASHDLRQPIHALGLFIGALRSRVMDDEARLLVDHIDGSVTAMDGLFASLLDISKLDAGVVTPQGEAVAIGALLKRLCADHAEEAAAKGVALRVVDCSATVFSDPFLLERIIRNIISNAVRYTDTGRVLIGCRRTAEVIYIDVWDTGRGIAEDQNALIFQEFYQVGNPERDRSKGLGLGLAIVQRMSALIDGRLTFRSRLGYGSMFRVQAPRCAEAPKRAVADLAAGAAATRSGTVLIIDDELAIQEAMTRLLSSWGHGVIAAGSLDELMPRLAALAEPPDIIISDYRLRGGENGIAAIQHILAHYSRNIPAMLITGDTAPDRISEAQTSGFTLLHKPLSNSKLRAAIGNLLRG